MHIHGHHPHAERFGPLADYWSDAPDVLAMMDERADLADHLHEALPIRAAQVVWGVRHEMARTVDDILARRTRALPLDARAAIDMAPAVARLMARELGRDAAWQHAQVESFRSLARGYLP